MRLRFYTLAVLGLGILCFEEGWASSQELVQPRALLKAGPTGAEADRLAEENQGWLPFDPPTDNFGESATDLRFLNEKFAGEHGFIAAKNGHFAQPGDGRAVRFWAVNGPPHDLTGEALRQCARRLAKYGVNLVRVHGGMFDKNGEVDMTKVKHAIEIVEAMKQEGIYTHFSIYFPLWFNPSADLAWLEGYDGNKHPFAALEFNPKFQEKYRSWWRALLTTPSPATGKPLTDEPAVFGLEMQNEDSFFFWTFSAENIPDAQLRLLEKSFGDWLAKKYGSLAAAFERWKGPGVKRDALAEGRVGFRPLWAMFNEKTGRDQDTAEFLCEAQTRFYAETRAFLRQLGFKGVITASNWSTASPEVFGPLEKLSYTAGDFWDRHGYFSCNHKGDNAAWSIRPGHTYADRSALRFEAEDPSKPRQFVHPIMDPHYDGMPSMISETTFTRPNRYRSEAPLYFAVYAALQDSDAIVHFALDGARWQVKPGFWMQPWTLMSPAMMGQFPAAALIYRRGLVAAGAVVARVDLNKSDLLHLRGTPLPQEAVLDELRLADVSRDGQGMKPGQRLDPLLHYAGRTEVHFVTAPGSVQIGDSKGLCDHTAQTVASTTGELKLDYGKGVLVVNSALAQGVSGALRRAGATQLKDLAISSDLELGHIVAVSLDDQPLATSGRILLQTMSEEKATGFATEPANGNLRRIVNIGRDPWMIKALTGTVSFKRPDATQLKVIALDYNGYALDTIGHAQEIKLQPGTLYYLISKP
jgi:hypothetical protein